MVASQTVLIILCLRPVIVEQASASIRALRGQVDPDQQDLHSNHRLKLTRLMFRARAQATSISASSTLECGDTYSANARKFERWPANVKSQYGAEEIYLEAFDPADRQPR
jgi:hypothetical protein